MENNISVKDINNMGPCCIIDAWIASHIYGWKHIKADTVKKGEYIFEQWPTGYNPISKKRELIPDYSENRKLAFKVAHDVNLKIYRNMKCIEICRQALIKSIKQIEE